MKHILITFLLLLVGCTTNINYHPKVSKKYNVGLAYESVVMLSVKDPDGGIMVATGFVYDDDRIITAGHFCISALEIQIYGTHNENGIEMNYYANDNGTLVRKKMYGLNIEKISKVEDMCVLRKEGHKLPALRIVDNYSKVKIRDKVVIVGIPMGVVMGEFYGRVMSPSYNGLRSATILGKLVVSSASTGGLSGSPVILEETGEVIGVLVRGAVVFNHLTFCVRGDYLKEFVESF